MLGFMKRLSRSFFGKLVLMVIIAGMAFWGVDAVFNQIRNGLGSDLAAAGGEAISVTAFDKRVENVLRNINASSQDPMTKAQAVEQGYVDQAFEVQKSRLVNLGYARQLGVDPSTDAVLNELKKVDAFKNPLTGELDLNTYKDVLYQNRFTQAEYEAQLQDELTLGAMRKGAAAGLIPPIVLTGIQSRFVAESRTVAFFIADASKAPVPAEPTGEEVKAFYDENLEVLKQPERRAIDMLKVSADDFLSQVVVTEQEVATVYEAAKSDKYSEPEQRTYVEMMFDSRDAARAAFAALAGGADPDTLAGVTSRETRTGFRDDVQDTFLQEAMFGPGKQSGALFGPKDAGDGKWLVARLISVQPGAVRPLEAVSEEIRSALANDRAKELLYQKMESLDRAIGAGYDVARIAVEIGVPVMSFAPVDTNGYTEDGVPLPALTGAGDAFEQAFQMAEGETSNLYNGADATYLTSVHKIVPAYTPDFDKVKDDVRMALAMRNESQAAQKMVDDIKARIDSGASTMAAEAAKLSTPLEQPPEPVTRLNAEQSGLPGAAIGALFAGKEGEVFVYPSRAGDLFMIVQLLTITEPEAGSMADLDSSSTAAVRASLENDLAIALDDEVSKLLKLRVNEAGFRAYKNSITTEQ